MNITKKVKKYHLGIILLIFLSLFVLNGCDSLENEPTASFNIDKHPEGPPLKVVVDASDSEGSEGQDGTIQKYEWNFGDGTTSSGRYVVQNHTYSSSGQYTITLTVTDHEGDSDTFKRTVTMEGETPDKPQEQEEKSSASKNDSDSSESNGNDSGDDKDPSKQSSEEVTPLEMMATVFRGNYSKREIERSVHKAMNRYDLPFTEQYEEKIGSVLVALRDDYGVEEMRILRCVNAGDLKSLSGVEFHEAAALCVTYIKSG